jgi:hypothetical protein
MKVNITIYAALIHLRLLKRLRYRKLKRYRFHDCLHVQEDIFYSLRQILIINYDILWILSSLIACLLLHVVFFN